MHRSISVVLYGWPALAPAPLGRWALRAGCRRVLHPEARAPYVGRRTVASHGGRGREFHGHFDVSGVGAGFSAQLKALDAILDKAAAYAE
jgi:hypothetical protein